jgi:hypothetical protein
MQRLIRNNPHRIITTLIPINISKVKRKYFELMTEPWIWQQVVADRVFVFQGNAAVCGNSAFTILDFAERWDYIGSPWGAFIGIGGEGSISIRNRLQGPFVTLLRFMTSSQECNAGSH